MAVLAEPACESSKGNAYVTGFTDSTNFPTMHPLQRFQTNYCSTSTLRYYDAFVTKLSPSGSALVYSTYLGGCAEDGGAGIAVDGVGNAYITGFTLGNRKLEKRRPFGKISS